MSGRAESLVWERARAKGSNLLVLVKLGDWANQEGRDAFCGPKALADICRMSERGVRYVLHKLERDGEIEIELNIERRELTIGKRTFAPEWFIHVRCVCEWDAYQLTPKSAKFSSSPFISGRRRRLKKPAKFAEQPAKFSLEPENFSLEPEKSRPTYKEGSVIDPITDPSIELRAGGSAPTSPKTDDENPQENLRVITRLAHDAIDRLGATWGLSDLAADVKDHCAAFGILYDGDVVRKALDSALWQQRHAKELV